MPHRRFLPGAAALFRIKGQGGPFCVRKLTAKMCILHMGKWCGDRNRLRPLCNTLYLLCNRWAVQAATEQAVREPKFWQDFLEKELTTAVRGVKLWHG